MQQTLSLVAASKAFGGWQRRYRDQALSLGCEMAFSIYLPPQAEIGPVPVLYWLSGLSCTDENLVQKAGAQRVAAELGIAIVVPDTSPRPEHVPGDPEGAWDFGQGAGFYLNATEAPWNGNYRMHDYVVNELPELIEAHFPVTKARAISGHSMGGNGALVCALRDPGRYRSVSAFSPITHPSHCPWGQKALSRYLGADPARWHGWDACELIASAGERLPCSSIRGSRTASWPSSASPRPWRPRARRPAAPSACVAGLATTTATTSSPASKRRRPDPPHPQHRLARRGPPGDPSGGCGGPRHP